MFIVIEGIDGAGKGTHTKRLESELVGVGLDACSFSFPGYEFTTFGKIVGEYLNGKYGEALENFPEMIATLFAVDRFERKEELAANIKSRDIVLCDRYCSSNVGYGCAKIAKEERDSFAKFLTWLDYDLFGMPIPDVVIYLDIPVKFSAQLIAKKKARSYTDKAEDLHEADHEFLGRVANNYRSLVPDQTRYQEWVTINLERNGHLRKEDDVFEDILTTVQDFLHEQK